MKKIKLLIIDDSHIVHIILEKILMDHEDIEIIGEAYNGEEGVALVVKLAPDIVIMDIGMPKMGGLEAIQLIMQEKPTPIIVFAAPSADIIDLGFQAIELGAVDIIEKPISEDISVLKRDIEENLIKSIKTFADFKVIRRIKSTTISSLHEKSIKLKEIDERLKKKRIISKDNNKSKDEQKEVSSDFPIIAIAASTGGPQTIKELIGNLSVRKLNIGIVIVQHMAEGFMQGFCDWLAMYSSVPVVISSEGDFIKPNIVYIAPGDYHLIFDKNGSFIFLDSPPIQGIRPSADLMFSSIAEVFKNRVIAIILTGMGNDGTEGLLKVKEFGGYVISQDEESSLIFGMPKSAIDAGVVDSVLNITKIPDFLEKLCRERFI